MLTNAALNPVYYQIENQINGFDEPQIYGFLQTFDKFPYKPSLLVINKLPIQSNQYIYKPSSWNTFNKILET